MYPLLLRLFLRQRAPIIAFILLLLLGAIGIGTGRQFLDQQEHNAAAVTQIQQEHIARQLKYHPEHIGHMLYYLKFAYIQKPSPLAGIAIGQSDLNTNIEHVTLLALEGQKYDTDLVNPSKLQAGNLDLSFVITFLFPLVIIALTFNLWHEEVEQGTWKMIKIQGQSTFHYLVAKLAIRLGLIFIALAILCVAAVFILRIPVDSSFIAYVLLSYLYLAFWFAASALVVSLGKSGGFNAVVLLSLWLVLVILAPAAISSYTSHRYPIHEAMTLSIKQRDAYHTRWDRDKQATIDQFNACYPQFKKYPLRDSGFSWHWYYAMQHMGDHESMAEQDRLLKQINLRESFSNRIAHLLPPVKIQLAMGQLAHTDLSSYMAFLRATTQFHEEKRLAFYPHIFENQPSSVVDWSKHTPQYHQHDAPPSLLSLAWSTALYTLILAGAAWYRLRRF